MTDKKKRPIFTYIVTVLSAFVPTFIMTLMGYCYVLVSSETAETFSLIELYFPAFILGAVINMVCCWIYFSKVRKRSWVPTWWSNLLLIAISYAAVPLFCFLMIQLNPDPEPTQSSAGGALLAETLFLSITGFIIIFRKTHKNRKPLKPRLLSPFWILLAIPTYYILFIFTAMTGVKLMEAGWKISGNSFYMIYKTLSIPFLTSATIELVRTYLPGPLGNIATIGNALVWGTIVWIIRRECAKKSQALEGNQ